MVEPRTQSDLDRPLDLVSPSFIWHELHTPDPVGARRFYSRVFRWKSLPNSPSEFDFSIWSSSSGLVGGLRPIRTGMLPRWIGYVAVPRIRATAAFVEELGGYVQSDPQGAAADRFVATDPSGASIGFIEAGSHEVTSNSVQARPGHVCWQELQVRTVGGAFPFYHQLLGWYRTSREDTPSGSVSLLAPSEGAPDFAAIRTDREVRKPLWCPLFRVASLGETVRRVLSAEGYASTPTRAYDGELVLCRDPKGTDFAIHQN